MSFVNVYHFVCVLLFFLVLKVWMLGLPPASRRPAGLDNSRARAYRASNMCRWGLFFFFFFFVTRVSFLSFLPLSGRRPDIEDLNTVLKGR